jgi:CHAD domain-containing protein
MAAHLPGVIQDLDPEFLHDFRVAVRRSRSLLSALKDVLPERAVARFRRDLAWLQQETGPLRDLDVHLAWLQEAGLLSPKQAHELAPVLTYLQERRVEARARLAVALRSQRYRAFLPAWQRFLSAPPGRGRTAVGRLSIRSLVGARTWQLYSKARRIGRRGGAMVAAMELHELRKRCKKLRYLQESFRALVPSAEGAAMVRALKSLQEVLGDCQDTVMQQEELRILQVNLAAAGTLTPALLQVLKRLEAEAVAREAAARARYSLCFAGFASGGTKACYRAVYQAAASAT